MMGYAPSKRFESFRRQLASLLLFRLCVFVRRIDDWCLCVCVFVYYKLSTIPFAGDKHESQRHWISLSGMFVLVRRVYV